MDRNACGEKGGVPMSIVVLCSGGLDSTLSVVLALEQGLEIHPLFVDYGQIAKESELNACLHSLERLGLSGPEIVNVQGFGSLYSSGLTNARMDIFEDAFLPGRNLLFLLLASTYACEIGAAGISIGILSEEYSLFPDQTAGFLSKAEDIISTMTGRDMTVIAPLIGFTKRDVVALAEKKGIVGTYSCHLGGKTPCGKCIACKEYDF